MTAAARVALTATLAIGGLGLCASALAAPPATLTHYVLDPAHSTLEFTFLQAGAKDHGRFTRFTVILDIDPSGPAAGATAGRLDVSIDIGALDTGDKERDDTLRGEELFAVAKYPQARFTAAAINRTASGFEAVGQLTIRGVTREARVPFTLRTASEGGRTVGYMSGSTTVRRLDFGVGQGDWRAIDQVGNEVEVSFALRLTAP